jgi:hypothetical protein
MCSPYIDYLEQIKCRKKLVNTIVKYVTLLAARKVITIHT